MKTRQLGFFILIVTSLFFLFYNLQNWPVTWYDEGIHLQIPKNLVNLGVYGVQSGEDFRFFDPLVNVGPALLLPVALSFKGFGIGLLQARVVIATFGFFSVILFYFLGKKIFDAKTALIASFLLLFLPSFAKDASESFLGLSRMALGEVPSLFFLLAAIHLWIRGQETKRSAWLVVSGVVFGLAMLIKEQNLLIFIVLVVIALVDRAWYHQLSTRDILIPLLIGMGMIGLYYSVLYLLPASSYLQETQDVNRLGALALSTLTRPFQFLKNLSRLSGSGFLVWGLPGMMYGIYLARGKDLPSLYKGFLLAFALVWMIWEIFASIGWIRYAFIGMAFATLFTAKLLADLSEGFTLSTITQISKEPGFQFTRKNMLGFVVLISVGLMILQPLQQRLGELFAVNNHAPAEFARFLDQSIAQGDVIESFEPEIVFLSDRTYHQPGLKVLMEAIKHFQFGDAYSPDLIDLSQTGTKYLINGPFSKAVEIYQPVLSQYHLLRTIGAYDLYQVVP